jgi:preprotein translocase subunit Sss1
VPAPSPDTASSFTAFVGLAGAILGGLIVGVSSLLLKQVEYLNDYNRIVLQKRISAYEGLEKLILALKIAVLDRDRKPYHLLFAKDEDWDGAYALTMQVMNESLWLSEEAFRATQKFNYLMFHDATSRPSAIEFGKRHYNEIALLREEMEQILARDMRTLHKVQRFLRTKSRPGNKEFIPLVSAEHDGLREYPASKRNPDGA